MGWGEPGDPGTSPAKEQTLVGSKRTVILIAAILIAAIAGYALYTYVNGVAGRAYDNAMRVKVFLVGQDIPAGTASDVLLAGHQIIERELPAEFLPPTALTDTALVAGKVAA